MAFGKLEQYEPDPEFVEGWGFQIRGNLIEDFAVQAIRAALPEGARLLYAGEEQETLVDEWLSATTDGVFVGLPRDCLAPLGVADTGPGGIVWDCKSLDPRYTSQLPKPEHTAQVQAAMGIIRKCYYPECPDYAVLSYIDASDWSQVQEFVVRVRPGPVPGRAGPGTGDQVLRRPGRFAGRGQDYRRGRVPLVPLSAPVRRRPARPACRKTAACACRRKRWKN